MKGYKSSDGKFHPITDYKKVTRKSRDSSTKKQGVKIVRKAREPSPIFLKFAEENPKYSAISGYSKLKEHPKLFRDSAGSFSQALWDGDIERAIQRADPINKKALQKILFEERKARDRYDRDEEEFHPYNIQISDPEGKNTAFVTVQATDEDTAIAKAKFSGQQKLNTKDVKIVKIERKKRDFSRAITQDELGEEWWRKMVEGGAGFEVMMEGDVSANDTKHAIGKVKDGAWGIIHCQ